MDLLQRIQQYDNTQTRNLPRDQRQVSARALSGILEIALQQDSVPQLSSFTYGVHLAAELRGNTAYAREQALLLAQQYNQKTRDDASQIKELTFFEEGHRIGVYNLKAGLYQSAPATPPQ